MWCFHWWKEMRNYHCLKIKHEKKKPVHAEALSKFRPQFSFIFINLAVVVVVVFRKWSTIFRLSTNISSFKQAKIEQKSILLILCSRVWPPIRSVYCYYAVEICHQIHFYEFHYIKTPKTKWMKKLLKWWPS